MKIKHQPITIDILGSTVTLSRTNEGVVKIKADNIIDYAKGLGFAHAIDRGLQMNMLAVIAEGRLSECFSNTEETNQIDIFMRKLSLAHEAKKEFNLLGGELKAFLSAYADGVNQGTKSVKKPLEFKLLRFNPEAWTPEKTLITIKIMSYAGLAQSQEDMEKFIIQAIQGDVDLDKLKSLFSPYLEELDDNLISKIKQAEHYSPLIPSTLNFNRFIPVIKNSNNWVLGPKWTENKTTLQCNDPHLEVNRLPAIWYESIGILPDNYLMGITMPGVPGLIMGRNKDVSFGFTYGFMDMVDFFIEEIKDGKYLFENSYHEFNKRIEVIKRKGDTDLTVTVYENENGILENENNIELKDGIYFSKAWSGHHQSCLKSTQALLELQSAKNTKEASEICSRVAISCNWLISDTQNNIAYQQSGNLPIRKGNGLVPLEGWHRENCWKGLETPDQLSSCYNPEEGFFCTANNNLNQEGKPLSINLPMGSYRRDRIKELIEKNKNHNVDSMMEIQRDLYSLQAEYFLKEINHLIPSSPLGRILKDWNCCYDKESVGATLFEIFYHNLLAITFGQNFFGPEVWHYAAKESMLHGDYYHLFDRVFLEIHDHDIWFKDISKEELYQKAIEKTFKENRAETLKKWGKVNSITMNHLLFDGKMPKFLGLDYGPIAVEGNRATIVQGGVYRAHNRDTSFCPSWRYITDMAESQAFTVLAGGVSDRRFSGYYYSDISNWLNYKYKILRSSLM